jgi:hypothetical protein
MCAGDDVDAFDDDVMDAAIRFDLTVELDETPGRRIEVTIDGEHPGETSSSSSSFSLTHPPPVTLHVIFPRDYPSIRPPMIALTASWLPPQTLDAACDAMEAMWVPGVPVVFEMATWLAGGKFIFLTVSLVRAIRLTSCFVHRRGGRMPRAGRRRGPHRRNGR